MAAPKEFRNPFPRWLVGEDATLAHAEDNALFVAFATWRRRSGIRLRFDFASWHNSGMLMALGMWVGIVLLRWSPAAGLTAMAVVVAVYAYAWKAYRASGNRAVAMPRYGYYVYGQVLNRAVAEELALVPMKPLELGRALYMELRASQRWVQLVTIVVLVALMLRAPLQDIVIGADGTEAGHAFVFAARVVLLVAIARFAWWGYAGICAGFVTEYLRGHIPEHQAGGARARRAIVGMVSFVGFMVLGGVCVGVLTYGRTKVGILAPGAMELLGSLLPDMHLGTRQTAILQHNMVQWLSGLYDLAIAAVAAGLAIWCRHALRGAVGKMDALSSRFSELSLEELLGDRA